MNHYKIEVTEALKEKFWKKVRKTESCWIFEGSVSKVTGYGRFSVKSRLVVNAQRVSWTIKNGPIPEDMFICHKCDNRICVNPNHLFIGSRQDNVDDMMKKKRGRHFKKNDYYGVIWEDRHERGRDLKGRWRSFICLKGKIKKIGAHTSMLEAARNYDRIAYMKYRIRDKLNFPEQYDLSC